MDLVGPYKISWRERLGRGAFGDVYKAVHKDTGQVVAAKCIEPKNDYFIEMTKREIETMRKVKGHVNILDIKVKGHVNILDIKDDYQIVKRKQVQFWIMTDLCDLGNFEKYAERFILSVGHKISIMRDIFAALAYLHDVPVIHRDIKAENVLFILEDGRHTVKLADFGTSREFVFEETLNTFAGTYAYMAPELVRYKNERHRAQYWNTGADKFSAGVLCYQVMKAVKGIRYDPVTDAVPSLGEALWINRYEKRHAFTIDEKDPELVKRVLKIAQRLVHVAPHARPEATEMQGEFADILNELPPLGVPVEDPDYEASDQEDVGTGEAVDSVHPVPMVSCSSSKQSESAARNPTSEELGVGARPKVPVSASKGAQQNDTNIAATSQPSATYPSTSHRSTLSVGQSPSSHVPIASPTGPPLTVTTMPRLTLLLKKSLPYGTTNITLHDGIAIIYVTNITVKDRIHKWHVVSSLQRGGARKAEIVEVWNKARFVPDGESLDDKFPIKDIHVLTDKQIVMTSKPWSSVQIFSSEMELIKSKENVCISNFHGEVCGKLVFSRTVDTQQQAARYTHGTAGTYQLELYNVDNLEYFTTLRAQVSSTRLSCCTHRQTGHFAVCDHEARTLDIYSTCDQHDTRVQLGFEPAGKHPYDTFGRKCLAPVGAVMVVSSRTGLYFYNWRGQRLGFVDAQQLELRMQTLVGRLWASLDHLEAKWYIVAVGSGGPDELMLTFQDNIGSDHLFVYKLSFAM